MTGKNICVFSSSSDSIDRAYVRVAEELAELLAHKKHILVYGGGNIGLMGAMAKAAHRKGGKVVGVIPEMLHGKGYSYAAADELIVTQDMRERKTVMEQRSDAFIGLPGGFGTLEEMAEILTLKQLKYHAKPVAFLNTNGFYDKLFDFFEHMFGHGFVKSKHRELYHVVPDAPAALTFLEAHFPPV